MPAPRGDPKHSKEDRWSTRPIVVTLTTGKSCPHLPCCHGPAQTVDTVGLTLAPQSEVSSPRCLLPQENLSDLQDLVAEGQ